MTVKLAYRVFEVSETEWYHVWDGTVQVLETLAERVKRVIGGSIVHASCACDKTLQLYVRDSPMMDIHIIEAVSIVIASMKDPEHEDPTRQP